MQQQNSSHKKKHFNRFAYLLESNKKQYPQRIIKDKEAIFQFNLCAGDPCKNQPFELQVKKQEKLFVEIQHRKPIKFQLLSSNYEIFKQKIQQKSSLSSFQAYTPSKDSEKQYFTINNEISTIQNTKSNYNQTHRNFAESIQITKINEDNWAQKSEVIDKSLRISNNFIKQTTIKDDIKLQEFTKFKARHTRVFTESFDRQQMIQKQKDSQKKALRYSTTQIDNSRNANQQQNINKNSLKLRNHEISRTIFYNPASQILNENKETKKYCIAKTTVMKTRQMSNKLQQSSDFKYQHSTQKTNNESLQKKSIKLKGLKRGMKIKNIQKSSIQNNSE